MDEGASKRWSALPENPRIVVIPCSYSWLREGRTFATVRLRTGRIGIANRISRPTGRRRGAWVPATTKRRRASRDRHRRSTDARRPAAGARVWDPELAPLMAETGRVVHEEALLGLLVADLLR